MPKCPKKCHKMPKLLNWDNSQVGKLSTFYPSFLDTRLFFTIGNWIWKSVHFRYSWYVGNNNINTAVSAVAFVHWRTAWTRSLLARRDVTLAIIRWIAKYVFIFWEVLRGGEATLMIWLQWATSDITHWIFLKIRLNYLSSACSKDVLPGWEQCKSWGREKQRFRERWW